MARGRKNAEETVEAITEITEVAEEVAKPVEKLVELVSEYPFLYIAPYNVQFVNGTYHAPSELVDKLIVYYGVSIK